MTKIILLITAFLGMTFLACNKSRTIENESAAFEERIPETVEKKPYTSTHIFEAKLKDIKYSLCMAYTTRCPVSCGASGDYATFEVIGYDTFLVNGEAGKDKLKDFTVLLSDYYKKDYDKNYVKYIRTLKSGDVVRLYVDFVYDTSQLSVGTVINILGFEKI
ncbi:MAG: hypothetical protein QM594_15170 [Niabella sp.]